MRDNLYVILAGVAAGAYGLAKVDPPPKALPAPTTQSAPAEIVIQATETPPPQAMFGWVPPSPADLPQVAQGPCPGGICPLPARPAPSAQAIPQAVVRTVPQAVYRSAGGCSAGSCAPVRRGLFGRILGR